MATRLFTLPTAPTLPLTAGDKSAVLPVGTDRGDFNENLSLSTSTSLTATTPFLYSTSPINTLQSAMMARHASIPLKAQTVAANTWTVSFIGSQNNNAANAFLAVSLYVYRPETGAVVGYIRDSATTVGVEFNGAVQTVTFAGSEVIASAGDILVLEAWNVATQQNNAARDITWSVGQLGGVNTYIETPQNLDFTKEKYQFFIVD
jgi:hypothetical protein